jgi:hypothetical protein
MVMVLEAQFAVTPAGSPLDVPMPVAPVVAWVMLVKALLMQSVGVLEAAPAVLFPLLAITRSSDEVAQLPLLMVHRRVAELPAARPVTVVVLEVCVVMLAVPLISDQSPVPTEGLFAAMVNEPLLHCAISGPALEVLGKALLVITTLSVEVHAPLGMVQRKVAGNGGGGARLAPEFVPPHFNISRTLVHRSQPTVPLPDPVKGLSALQGQI